MRILQVVHGFLPERRGGTEIYTYNLSKELSRRHEVHVFHPSMTSRTKEYSVNKCDGDSLNLVEHVGREDKGQLPLAGLRARANLKHTYINTSIHRDFEMVLDETEPHIVHFQHLINLSASLIELVKERRIPAVLTLHDFWFICPRINLLKNDYSVCKGPDIQSRNCFKCYSTARAESKAEAWVKYGIRGGVSKALSKAYELSFMTVTNSGDFKRRQERMKSLLLMVDKLIAPSRFLRNIFIQYGIPGDRIIYSSNGYDLSAFEGFKRKEHDKLVFGFAGGVAKHKGVHVLVEAFNKVENENVELRIYGTYDPKSNYFKELQSVIRNDNIKFMGRYTDVREPYSNVDVLVVPSIWYETGGPLVVIEALIAKTPVIASNIGCIPEFIEDGATGLLFETGNAEDLFYKMKLVLENPDLMKKFKSNIKPVETIQEQAKEIEAIYEDLRLRSGSIN